MNVKSDGLFITRPFHSFNVPLNVAMCSAEIGSFFHLLSLKLIILLYLYSVLRDEIIWRHLMGCRRHWCCKINKTKMRKKSFTISNLTVFYFLFALQMTAKKQPSVTIRQLTIHPLAITAPNPLLNLILIYINTLTHFPHKPRIRSLKLART